MENEPPNLSDSVRKAHCFFPAQAGKKEVSLPALSPAEIAGDAVIAQLQAAGSAAFRVGGCVRDRLLGHPVAEVDVVTAALPEQVMKLFPRTYSVGLAFGVVIVHADNDVDVEVATFREDLAYADGRHPEGVCFADAAGDARRRDFTINALFYDPAQKVLLDFGGGLDDLRLGIVRTIGNPGERFREDHLRLLRAVRFAAELDFALEPATAAALRPLAGNLSRISAERVYREMTRMLLGRHPRRALELLFEHDLLTVWLPEVKELAGVPQPPQFHPEGDVWQHTLAMLESMRAPMESLAWAVLLHDIGKPPTFEFRDGRERFPSHAKLGGEICRTILTRLRVSNQVLDAVTAAVAGHMTLGDVCEMRPARLRRLIAAPTFPLELELHRLDCLASHRDMSNYTFLLDMLMHYEAELPVPPPLLRGHDLLALGMPPGPRLGLLLKEIQDRQLNWELRTPQEALAWVREKIRTESIKQ